MKNPNFLSPSAQRAFFILAGLDAQLCAHVVASGVGPQASGEAEVDQDAADNAQGCADSNY